MEEPTQGNADHAYYLQYLLTIICLCSASGRLTRLLSSYCHPLLRVATEVSQNLQDKEWVSCIAIFQHDLWRELYEYQINI